MTLTDKVIPDSTNKRSYRQRLDEANDRLYFLLDKLGYRQEMPLHIMAMQAQKNTIPGSPKESKYKGPYL